MSKPTLDEIIEVYMKASTAVVGDIIRSMGNPAIVCDPKIKSAKPDWRFCGQAYTLQYQPYRKGDVDEVRKLIEKPKEKGVVVVATYDSIKDLVYWGDNMNSQAKATGAIARIVDGNSRDIRDHIEDDFPLFLRNATSGAIYGVYKPISNIVNVPVVFGGVRCEPGDIVMGDDDGIIIVPRKEAEKSLSHILWKIEMEKKLGDASRKADWKARGKIMKEQKDYMAKLKDL